MLSNLIARGLDARPSRICTKLGWTYTRYADDLSFSAVSEPVPCVGYLLARVRPIAADEGFAVNEKKNRVLRRSAAQTVIGIVVNDRPGASRETVRRLRAILYRARQEGLEDQNCARHPSFANWVGGMISYVSMVNPDQGGKLRRGFEAVRE